MPDPKIPKVATTSENIQNENLEKLRSVFPNFVKDGEVDFDALQAFLKNEWALAGEEKYGLSWAGKSNAFRAIRTPATGTLTPQPEESKNWDTTQNIFIEWDNLEVLKLLQKHYRGEIKMIYIDPPYNTGKDFVYKDNFTKWVADYYEQTGQTKDGIKMTANTEKNGRYHSDWLTMMYPRLFLAHNLLREDGVIFVSIDDNEVANLRMIMDEIFGEENFVSEFIWEKKKKPSFLDLNVWKLTEYIVCYTKNQSETFPFSVDTTTAGKKYPVNNAGNWLATIVFPPRSVQFKMPDGIVRAQDMSEGVIKTKLLEDVEIENSTNKNELVLEGEWRYSQAKINEIVENEETIIISKVPFRPNHVKTWWDIKKMKNIFSPVHYQMETNEDATEQIVDIFWVDLFDNPKPLKLLNFLVKSVTYQDESPLILDFFAGSGTTAHAVMQLNAEDEGNRRFICVQLPESTEDQSEAYKAGYKKISDISRERIRRAGDKIWKGDIGFKSFVLESSNYRQWNTLSDSDDADALKAQMKLFAEKPLLDEADEAEVVYELLVKEGFWLNALVKEVTVGDLKVWKVLDEGRGLAITFASQVSQRQIEFLKLTDADTFVCFDSALDDTTKVNLVRNFNIKVI